MPPDLSEAARSLAVLPPQSCGEVLSASPPSRPSTEYISSSNGIVDVGLQSQEYQSSPRPVAENFTCYNGGQSHQPHSQVVGSEAGNGGGGCNDTGARKPILSSFINMYHLTPALRATFASVGATDRNYLFREVLQLLKKYLFSKVHLFDPDDKLYVNCASDPLGQALQVDRFHYNDVKLLISKHIIRAQPDSVNGACSQTIGNGYPPRTPPSCALVNTNNGLDTTNGRTELLVPTSTTTPGHSTTSGTCFNSRELLSSQQSTGSSIPVPGPSRESEGAPDHRRHSRTTNHLPYTVLIPEIPDSNSEAESEYSIQGYETALCRNTEFEESDDEELGNEDSYEEYEIASDDAKEEEHSDDDDSVVEYVEIALLAIHALCQDDSEEDFWADDSDTDDQSLDDPELVVERWDCLSCGVKNKPFVRYCDKCWQVRKNWLPDRPRKRRRKPRPKKRRTRFRSESIQSDDQSSEKTLKTFENFMVSNCSTGSTSYSQELEELPELPRTSSTASTVSLKSGSPCRSVSFDKGRYSSQDSGISLSQDLLIEFDEEQNMEDNRVQAEDVQVSKVQLSHTHQKPSISRECISTSTLSLLTEANLDAGASSSRKRKSSISEDVKPHKRAKDCEVNESSDEEESDDDSHIEVQAKGFAQFLQSPAGKERLRLKDINVEAKGMAQDLESAAGEERLKDINIEVKAKGFIQFLQTPAGNEWLNSPDGKQFLYSQNFQEVLVEAYGTDMSMGSSSLNSVEPSSGISSLCSICCLRPKNAAIIHGRLSHQATCYQCARRLLNSGSRCPVCRRKIHMVCKHIIT
ncbi:E3 ubiquitin-protein ligase Mdm2-like isoform X2 [Homarus americanus]|nr:E3 ubiquitin-protein ligase Mdm2-like isoform X2 [Homarus americanus]